MALPFPAQHDLLPEAEAAQQPLPLAFIPFPLQLCSPSILTGETFTKELEAGSYATSTYETLLLSLLASFLTYDTVPLTGQVLVSIEGSIEANFAAAALVSVAFAVEAEPDLPVQVALAAAGLAVHDLLQDDCCACTPTTIREKKKIEKRTFFIVFNFFLLFNRLSKDNTWIDRVTFKFSNFG
jgi:hypothetical protein